MKVSIKMISEITGFSPATVSNALNYKKGVNQETSAKILAVAQDLGYFKEGNVRKLKFVTFKRSGEVVTDTPFFSLMLNGVEAECRANGIELQISSLNRFDANYGEQVRWLQNDRESMVILLGTEMTDEDKDLITGMTTPCVVIDYWKEDESFNSILINNEDAMRRAAEYLIHKGHKSIGYIRGEIRIKPFRTRFYGYQIAMRRAKLPIDERMILTLPVTMNGAYEAMKNLIGRGIQMPTAFCVDNDMIALGVMKALEEKGIRIPEDVSIIGFDDLPFSSIASPPLSTLRVPKQEMGREAVRRLLNMCRDKNDVNMKVLMCTQFIERSSVKGL